MGPQHFGFLDPDQQKRIRIQKAKLTKTKSLAQNTNQK